uniref:Photosystem I assembly protein Ycf3 n=1 Tax=Candidatus Methanogaster sp. ANME-2c ERB4 TaxID=2759911 RepID=A0A7G9YLU9_9EURY|nr:photosystem I assembly protein Ycf3 [Methanosarcinales archaeon ANME-2c ERB4]
MPGNEQELLKLETEIYHSDGGIYFADCDTASTRDEIAQQLENRFINKNIKIIKVTIGVGEIASTRDEIARHLERVSSSKDERRSEIAIRANDLAYTLNRYRGDDAAFFVYLPPKKPELEDLARILNHTRDEFARIKQPIIIWADKVSLGIIARSAPDFWAWRARVSEFKGVSDGLGYGGEVEAAETIWRGKISDEEIQSYERALAEFQERGDEREAAKVLGQLALLYYRSSEWDRVIEYYEKSMEIFEALGDRHGLAQTYNNLGLVYADKGEWDLAIDYYEKSMKIFEALGDRNGLARTYNNLGSVYYRKGEWDLAIDYYKKSMKIKDALGDRHGLAQTCGNLGLVYADKGEWDLAIDYYEKDIGIFEALGDRHGLAQTYNNLGLVYARKGEWDRAIEYCEKSIEISEALGDRHGLARTYNNLGSMYARKGEWDHAIEYLKKSMKISDDLGDRHGLARTYGSLGSMYARKGEWDHAIEYYEKDIKIDESIGDQHGAGIAFSNIGKVYIDRSNPIEAKRNLEEAIEKIHPDARPGYPNALNWLAVSLRMIADQNKHEAKLAASGADRKKLVFDAAELYREAGERYEETHRLPLARMPRSLLMDAHLTRGLSYSVQNITAEDADKAIELLDSAIAEMKEALEFADGADIIRLKGAIASHEAKRCVREIDLHKKDTEKWDHLLDLAIDYLGEASESFGSLGETGACNSKICDGCRHLYTALGLIRDGYREESNQKIVDAVSEIRLAEECYESISNELGTDVVDQVNEILRCVADNLKNVEGFDPGGAVDAANNVFDALDEIAGVGLRNMIKILVFDEAGNVTEKKTPKAGQIATDGGINISIDNTRGDVDIHRAGHTAEAGKEPSLKKQRSVSRWDLILGAISGFSVDAIAIILMHYYFEESVKSHPILLVALFAITLLTTIFIRHKISKS